MDKINEITKMIDEWKAETNERSAFAIIQDEHKKIKLHHTGRRIHITTALASVIAHEKDIYEEIVVAMLLVSNRVGLKERLKLVWTFLTGKW